VLLPEQFISRTEIDRRTSTVLATARRTGLWDGTPAIPVELLAESQLGLSVLWETFAERAADEPTLLGALFAKYRTIWLNESERPLFEATPGLEPFTIAHEIGHFCLHIDPAYELQSTLQIEAEAADVLCRAGDTGWREVQAEMFAASLLMPEDLIRRHAAGCATREWPNVYRLKTEFGVSVTAMKNRLRGLGFETPADPDNVIRLRI